MKVTSKMPALPVTETLPALPMLGRPANASRTCVFVIPGVSAPVDSLLVTPTGGVPGEANVPPVPLSV